MAEGRGDTDVEYLTTTVSFGASHRSGFSWSADIPWVSLDGPAGDAAGLEADVVVRTQQTFYSDPAVGSFAVQFGARLGTGDDNENLEPASGLSNRTW